MENIESQIEDFFKVCVAHIKSGHNHYQPRWGKLSWQGVIEHLEDSINTVFDNGNEPFMPDKQELMIQFIHGSRQFKENTKHPFMSETPPSLKYPNLDTAIDSLQIAIDHYLKFRKTNPDAKPVHPGFGSINMATWDALHIKHFSHHLQQFGLIPR